MTTASRTSALKRALGLEYLTVSWNLVEGIIAVTTALGAGSVALLSFGIDSFVEMTSGLILIWRLSAERRTKEVANIEALDRRARRLVAASLFLLAAWVTYDALGTLLRHERPEASMVGIILTSLSLAVMWWLARAKRRSATAIGSRALETDAFQTTACIWLSFITLFGIGLNTLWGWWWADPTAALGTVVMIVREGREAWRGEDCCG